MTKRILLPLLFIAINAKSQTQKDNLLVGANLANAQATFQSGGTTVGMSISPKIGYFIKRNFAIGLGLNLGVTGGGGITTINYGVLPFARYYFSAKEMKDANAEMKSKRMRFFLEADFGISGSNTLKQNAPNITTNGMSFSAGPGMAYFITPNVGLETLLKLRGIAGFGTSSTAFQPELNIGFQIYLPTKRAKAMYNEEKRNMAK
jgi:hypothetical protein